MDGVEHEPCLEELAGLVREVASRTPEISIGHTRAGVGLMLRFSSDRARCTGRVAHSGSEWSFTVEVRGRSAKFQVEGYPRSSTLYFHGCRFDRVPTANADAFDGIYRCASKLRHLAAFRAATEGIRQSGEYPRYSAPPAPTAVGS